MIYLWYGIHDRIPQSPVSITSLLPCHHPLPSRSLAHYFPETKEDWSPHQAAVALLESSLMTSSINSATTASTSTRTDRYEWVVWCGLG
jgi:hypothetical protein